MHRFFVSPEVLSGQDIRLGPAFAHRLGRVLRLRPGDRVVLLDNSGWECEAQLTQLTQKRVDAQLKGRTLATGEPALHLHLYQALIKGDRFEMVLQKGRELGITSFTPVTCLRSVALAPTPDQARPLAAYSPGGRRAISSGPAAPASPGPSPGDGSGQRPRAASAPLGGRAKHGPTPGLGQPSGNPDISGLPQISLFIGPEGGWDERDIALARRGGAVAVSLGPRILRAETAGLVAAAAILYHYGQLGG